MTVKLINCLVLPCFGGPVTMTLHPGHVGVFANNASWICCCRIPLGTFFRIHFDLGCMPSAGPNRWEVSGSMIFNVSMLAASSSAIRMTHPIKRRDYSQVLVSDLWLAILAVSLE